MLLHLSRGGRPLGICEYAEGSYCPVLWLRVLTAGAFEPVVCMRLHYSQIC